MNILGFTAENSHFKTFGYSYKGCTAVRLGLVEGPVDHGFDKPITNVCFYSARFKREAALCLT
jgi:hypothetical protein